jgi:hypothetical protein
VKGVKKEETILKKYLAIALILSLVICLAGIELAHNLFANASDVIVIPTGGNYNDNHWNKIQASVAFSNGTVINGLLAMQEKDNSTLQGQGTYNSVIGVATLEGTFLTTSVTFKWNLSLPTGNLTGAITLPASGSWNGTANLSTEDFTFKFMMSGSSFSMGDGIETGPWTIASDPTVPMTATFSLGSRSGTFNLESYGEIIDMPNVKENGSSLKLNSMSGYGSFTYIYYGPSVGGIAIPVSKFVLWSLLLASYAPLIGLISTIIAVTIAIAVYVIRGKRREEKHAGA